MSIGNIENFLQSGLNLNGARPSRFTCQVSPPPALVFPNGVTKFTYTCRAASIPSFEMGVVPIGYFGRILKYSGDRSWNDWEVSVLLDEDYVTRNLFEIWSNGINELENNAMDANYAPSGAAAGTAAPYGGYKSTIMISHYSQFDDGSTDGKIIGSYSLIGAWPASIGPINLSWNQRDSISEFTVRFAFDNCVQNTQLYNVGFIQPSNTGANTILQA